MSKIKKLVSVIILLILSVFIFSACSNDIGSDNSGKTNSSQAEINSSTDNDENTSNTLVPVNKINWASASRYSGEAYNTETEEYIYTDGKINESSLIKENIDDTAIFWGSIGNESAYFKTLSFRYDGDEKIVGKLTKDVTVEQREEYITILDSIFVNDSTRNVYVKDYMDEKSTGYSSEYGEKVAIRTNCNWNITPSKYLYINYDKDEREPKQIWIDEIENVICNDTGSTDTPAIIRESWEFTTGECNIAIVNACNIYHNGYYTPVEYSEDLYPSSNELPYGEKHYIYALTVIFCNDKIVTCINVNDEEKYYIPILSKPLNAKEGIKSSFIAPVIDRDNKSRNMVIMRDSNGNNTAFPLYYSYEAQDVLYRRFYNETQPGFCIIDIDGDGIVEIIGFGVGYANSFDSRNSVYNILNETTLKCLGDFSSNGQGYKLFPFEYNVKF